MLFLADAIGRLGGEPAGRLAGEPYLTREAASGTRAVAQTGGSTLISRLAIEDAERAGALLGMPVPDLDLTRELRAIARARPAPTGAARVFWRWLAAQEIA